MRLGILETGNESNDIRYWERDLRTCASHTSLKIHSENEALKIAEFSIMFLRIICISARG